MTIFSLFYIEHSQHKLSDEQLLREYSQTSKPDIDKFIEPNIKDGIKAMNHVCSSVFYGDKYYYK